MRSADVFPSKYLKAADLAGREFKLTIADCKLESVARDEDDKPVLYFHGAEKGLVLNVTNWNTIADDYGDESDDWRGKSIVLYPDKTDYQGKRVACIRIKMPTAAAPARSTFDKSKKKAAAEPPPAEPDLERELDDEIPF